MRSEQQVVVYELIVQEEVEGVRQEVQEVEGENKARRNAHMNMTMWMGVKDSLLEPRCVCTRCDVLTHKKKLNSPRYAQTMWK